MVVARWSITPNSARLSASVPPLVNTISLGFRESSRAIEVRADSSARRACWPAQCTEDAFPKRPSDGSPNKIGVIASRTSGRTGAVAL